MSAVRTPQTMAIAKIEKAEGFTPEEVVNAVECVMRDPDLANAYLALSNPGVGAALIRREIKKFRGTASRTPQTLAIARIEKAEGFTQEEVVNAVECIMRDPDLANVYLALSNPDLGEAIIRREVAKFLAPCTHKYAEVLERMITRKQMRRAVCGAKPIPLELFLR